MLVMKDIMIAKGKVEAQSEAQKIYKIQDVQDDGLFMELLKNPKVLDLVENFCGKNIKTVHNMIVNKPPQVDGRHPMHQDLLYFPFRPIDQVVGAWLPLESVNRENGTLAVIPGSHKLPLLEHGMPEDMENLNLAFLVR